VVFKKRNYTNPIICKHTNDVTKDWYVFFQYKHEGKVYKFKRRERINRIKYLNEKIQAINELLFEIQFDLKNGWNPIIDPKREFIYSTVIAKNEKVKKQRKRTKSKPTKEELKLHFHNKGLTY
jgi:hypothetical protein